MNRVILLITLALSINLVGVSQEKMKKYFSAEWTELNSNNGKYVREITKIKDSLYFVQDFLSKGMKLEMKGYFKSIEPFIEHGPIEFFDKKGNQIIIGNYCNGDLCGVWKYNNYPRKKFSAEIDYNFNPQNLIIPGENYNMAQKMAQFPGGPLQMRNYIYNNLVIPYSGIRRGIEGRCLVRFVINEEGNTENIELLESCYKDYDKEALRLIKEMPKWEPAENNGVKTKISMTLPISFELPE